VTPISDVRGSADYRRALARNILVKFWHEAIGGGPSGGAGQGTNGDGGRGGDGHGMPTGLGDVDLPTGGRRPVPSPSGRGLG
jgi:hypothetical protein